MAERPSRARPQTRAAPPRARPPGRLRWKAYERFAQQILASRIRPGQFVSQRELAALTGLPLGAIREVIPRLEAEGLLLTAPQRGLQIASVDVKLVRNAFQLRLLIEREATAPIRGGGHRCRARRGWKPRIATCSRAPGTWSRAPCSTPLRRSTGACTTAWSTRSATRLISGIYRVNSLRIRLIRLERVVLDEKALAPAMAEHLALIAALRTRDPRRAVAAIEAHLTHARNRALGL